MIGARCKTRANMAGRSSESTVAECSTPLHPVHKLLSYNTLRERLVPNALRAQTLLNVVLNHQASVGGFSLRGLQAGTDQAARLITQNTKQDKQRNTKVRGKR